MKLLSKRQIPRETCYDLSVGKNKNFFANGVLVHNTNAAVVFEKNNGFYCQSREQIITPEKDNAGAARWANSVSEEEWGGKCVDRAENNRNIVSIAKIHE